MILVNVEMHKHTTAWKVSKYRVFSGPYFPVSGLNTKIYEGYFRITEYGETRTRKNFIFGHFLHSLVYING